MSDESLYILVRTEFEPVRLPHGLDEVTARGREVRRRRRVAGTVALAVILAAGLGLALPAHRPLPAHQPAKSQAPMQLAAWSVDPRPDGTVVLTIRQLARADQLTDALKKAGIPALVEFKQIDVAQTRMVGCEDQQPALQLLDDVMPPQLSHANGAERVFEIHRASMPAGTSLHFVIFAEGQSRVVQTALVRGDPVPCRLLK
jgi:hypothetical protein